MSEYISLVNSYIDRGMTDGLPVIPPTADGVAAMIDASGRSADDVLGETKFRTAPITVRDVAINALMAGCRPEYMRVVVPALEVIFSEDRSTFIVSTASFTPFLVVNGPVRHELNINAATNVLGPGFRANMTIGRAMRLCMINLCGARNQVWERTTMGSAYQLSWVMAEDEEASPWPPLHVDSGYDIDRSVVTIGVGMHPFEINHLDVRDPEALMLTVADFFAQSTHFNNAFVDESAEYRRHPLNALIMLGGDHRSWVAKAGWSKSDIKEFLVANTVRRAGDVRRRGFSGYNKFPPSATDDELVYMFDGPENVEVISTGGPGAHSAVARTMWTRSVPVPS